MYKWIVFICLSIPKFVIANQYVGIINQDAAMAYSLAHQSLDPSLPATWTTSTPPPAGPYQEVQTIYVNERSVLTLIGQIPAKTGSSYANPSPVANTPNTPIVPTDPNTIPYGY